MGKENNLRIIGNIAFTQADTNVLTFLGGIKFLLLPRQVDGLFVIPTTVISVSVNIR